MIRLWFCRIGLHAFRVGVNASSNIRCKICGHERRKPGWLYR